MRNAPTALSALYCATVCTTHPSPLPLATPTANYQYRQQPHSSLSLSWLAQDACCYTSSFKLPDSHCRWKGAGGSGKENRVKSRFVCTPTITYPRHRKLEVLLWRALLWVGAMLTASPSNEMQRDDLLQAERLYLSKGAVRQCNWASLLLWQACPTPSFPSLLLPFCFCFFFKLSF